MAISIIAARASIGLLIGVLVGLSTSPVVGTVLGILATIVTALVGPASRDGSDDLPSVKPKAAYYDWGLCAFALACIGGIALGIFVRTNNVLAPTPAQELSTWKNLHYSDADAHLLTAYESTGLILTRPNPDATPARAGATHAPVEAAAAVAGPDVTYRQSLLRADTNPIDASECTHLREMVEDNDSFATLKHNVEVDAADWPQTLATMRNLPNSRQAPFLKAAIVKRCKTR